MKTLILLTTVVCIGAPQARVSNAQPAPVSVENALKLFVRNGPGDYHAAQRILDQLPHSELINQSLEVLRESVGLDAKSRQFIYRSLTSNALLATANEQDVNALITLFSEGLEDSELRTLCITGLSRVPAWKRQEAVNLLLAEFAKRGFPTTGISAFLNSVVAWGEDARMMQPVLPDIEQIFHDPSADNALRGVAAAAMLRIGPTSRALEQFAPQDANIVLGPLAFVGSETSGTYNSDDKMRVKVRVYVRQALSHDDPEVRTHAFEALLPAYAHDFVVRTCVKRFLFADSGVWNGRHTQQT